MVTNSKVGIETAIGVYGLTVDSDWGVWAHSGLLLSSYKAGIREGVPLDRFLLLDLGVSKPGPAHVWSWARPRWERLRLS